LGSVKDLEIIKKPKRKTMGIGRFHFSDRYSVFDWGEMPDKINEKGAALCIMGAYCFEKLEEKGIKTHYRGLVTRKGKTVQTKELEEPVNIMEFDLVNVIRPKIRKENEKLKYDYSMFKPNLTNFLIPLEIIYRNGLPEGSSIFKRLEQGAKPQDFGLNHYPKPGEKLEKPIFDVSTKLEEQDRYISWAEAQKISGLTNEEITELKKILLDVDNLITEIAEKAKLENEDGKIELAFDPSRKFMIVDVVGTLDECRFTYKGLHISKEIARQYYRKTNWYKDLEKAKKEAAVEGVIEWKKLCKTSPPKLPSRLKKIIEELYMSTANAFTGLKLFDTPPLTSVIKEYEDYLEDHLKP